jgi:hypothetical protein
MKLKLVALILAGGALAASAQQNAANVADQERQRVNQEIFRQPAGAPGSDEAEAAHDLGRMSPVAAEKNFTFSNLTGIEWNSNARLSSANEQDSPVVSERLGLKYKWEFAKQWTLNAAVHQQFLWFTSASDVDFLGQTLDTNVAYQFKEGPRLHAGGGLYRYESTNRGDQLIQAGTEEFGIDDSFRFFEGRSALFCGYTFTHENTRPGAFDKLRHQALVGWNQALITNYLAAQAFYSFAYTDYQRVEREDKNSLAGVNLTWTFNQYVALTGFFNHTWNYSSNSGCDYKNLATGVLLNFNFRF